MIDGGGVRFGRDDEPENSGFDLIIDFVHVLGLGGKRNDQIAAGENGGDRVDAYQTVEFDGNWIRTGHQDLLARLLQAELERQGAGNGVEGRVLGQQQG